MKPKKQAGFTLIELIIVIVILGILAVSASPKFVEFTSDANESAMQGLAGSLKGAANVIYSKALVEGEASSADQALTGVTNVTVDFGYPQADATTITEILDLDTTNDWEIYVDAANHRLRIFPQGDYEVDNTDFGDDLNCYVQYQMDDGDSSNTPVYVIQHSGC